MARDTAESNGSEARKPLVPAISRAVRVLHFLRSVDEGATLTDIVRGAGFSKSTAFAVVRTMVDEALLSFDETTRRYALGPAIIELGASAIGRSAPITVALRHMHQLSEETLLASVAVQRMPDGHFVVVEKVESRQEVKVTIQVGHVAPSDSPILSRLWNAWSTTPLTVAESPQPYTAATITDTERIDREVRLQGFAAAYGEYMANLNAAGVPIFSSDAEPCLAIVILGMGDDLNREHIAVLAPKLITAARDVTISIGGKVPEDYPEPSSVPTLIRRPGTGAGRTGGASTPL